jgi:hypothetical protein
LKHLNDLGHEPPRTESKLNYEVRNLGHKNLAWLMSILADNILIGSSDDLPGVKGSLMPKK